MSPRLFYRTVAIAEAVTWTGLIAGILLRNFAGWDLAVLIAGSAHGLVFLTYAATSLLVGFNQRWGIPLIILGVITAIVPYATIPFDIVMDRKGRLAGDWRRDETDDPRDRVWTDRLTRWFLRRPAVLVVVFIVAVLAIMTVLLIIGPPGGWN